MLGFSSTTWLRAGNRVEWLLANPRRALRRAQAKPEELAEAGVRRVLKRRMDKTWRQFRRSQASTMLPADFFHVQCAATVQRLYCFFVLEICSRSVHILGITTNPDRPWTTQQPAIS